MTITADVNRPVPDPGTTDRLDFVWGLLAAILLHGLVALVLLGKISGYETQPGQTPIDVQIVPVPELQLPEETTPPEPQQETPAAEEPPAQDQPPEQDQPQDQAQEQEQQVPPEQTRQQLQEQAEEKPQEPEPEPAPEEEPAPAPAETADAEPAASVMQPVQEFAEEDSAPAQTSDAPLAEPQDTAPDAETTSQDQSAPADVPPGEGPEAEAPGVVTDNTTQEPAQESQADAGEQSGAAGAADGETDQGTEDAAPEDLAAQPPPETSEDVQDEVQSQDQVETDLAEEVDPLAGPQSGTASTQLPVPEVKPQETGDAGTGAEVNVGEADEIAPEDYGTVGPIVTAAVPALKPPAPSRRQTGRQGQRQGGGGGQRREAPSGGGGGGNLIAARQLYSSDILGDQRARTAMRGMPEGQRLNLLCMTELRAQLSAASAVPPELLPSFRPRGGTVLEPRRAAFRSLGRWFDVPFRCETDSGVTRVEKFGFRIGNEIPKSQWLSRGLTGF